MSDEARWNELRSAYNTELADREPVLNQLLLQLEDAAGDEVSRREAHAALYRELHTLKGAARAVELPRAERLAHALESALERVPRGMRPPDAWFTVAFQAVDTLVNSGNDGASDNDWSELIAMLESSATQAVVLRSPQPTPTAAPRSTESVRVGVGKLDTLLSQAGELAVTRIRIEQRQAEARALQVQLALSRREKWGTRNLRALLRATIVQHASAALERDLQPLMNLLERAEEQTQQMLEGLDALAADLRRDSAQLRTVSRAIEDEVMAIRLVPVEGLFSPFERMVRDLAHTTGKDVRLVTEGAKTEIDRKIMEQLRDPLMHMVRNAVDHGIEAPDVRVARGKPRVGTVCLSAQQRANSVEVIIQDDGAGLDPSRLRATAVRMKLLSEEEAAASSDSAARELIFRPGFSTSSAVSETSGRGVGMDVVREHVVRLGGQVTLDGSAGSGTTITISVPLTLATTRAILAEQHGQVFAIPSAMVERSARLRGSDAASIHGRQVAIVDGHPLPVVELSEVLSQQRSTEPVVDWRSYFVLRRADVRVGVLVDRLIGEQELVVKRLGWPLNQLALIEGGAVLSSGQTVIILNPSDLLTSAWEQLRNQSSTLRVEASNQPAERRKRRLLVVDDSLTTRTLERTIFEAAGYDVAVASDGIEALKRLHSETVDAIVSDVEMPRMDGFALTAAVRRDEATRHLPVILVTSLEAREHRERGVAVGADAYIVKSRFDQGQLLETVGRLVAA
jgi:two-component system chemotaxis sensor kinase CheA